MKPLRTTGLYSILLATFLSAILGISCRQPSTNPDIKPPVLGTTTISEVKTASAKASSSLKEVGFGASTTSTISDFGFCYGPKENPTTSDTKLQSGTTASQPQDFSGNLTGLTGGTKYFVRAYVVHEGGTVYSDQVSFTTENLKAPDVVTLDVSDIGTTAFSLTGKLNGAGTGEVTQYGHVLSETSQTPTTADTKTEYGSTGAPKDFKSTFNNLKINTTYYARAYATSSVGTSYGELRTVKTLNAVAPTVTTGDISNVSTNAATVGMNVVTVGTNSNLQAGVCWSSTNQTPTVNDSKTSAGASSSQFFSNSLTNLTPNTTYYVRAYATSSVGTGYGEVKSFKTQDLVAPVLSEVKLESDKLCGGTFSTAAFYDKPCLVNPVPNAGEIRVSFTFQPKTETIASAGICVNSDASSSTPEPTVNDAKLQSGSTYTTLANGTFTARFNVVEKTGKTMNVDCGACAGGLLPPPCGTRTATEYIFRNASIVPYTVYLIGSGTKQSIAYRYRAYVITTSGKVYYGATTKIDAAGTTANCTFTVQ